MVYLTRKTTRGQHYYYLVKSFKYDGRVEKVQQYLGSDEPNETELEQLKQQYTIDLELSAIERMAVMSSETYRTPYLKKSALLGLERMRFLNRALHIYQWLLNTLFFLCILLHHIYCSYSYSYSVSYSCSGFETCLLFLV